MVPQKESGSKAKMAMAVESQAIARALDISKWPPPISLRCLKTQALDLAEFIRFVLTGIAAATGNLIAVWMARRYQSFEISLLVGIVVGLIISFILSKRFAFGSRSWRRVFAGRPDF